MSAPGAPRCVPTKGPCSSPSYCRRLGDCRYRRHEELATSTASTKVGPATVRLFVDVVCLNCGTETRWRVPSPPYGVELELDVVPCAACGREDAWRLLLTRPE